MEVYLNIYLASPYSNADPIVRQNRFEFACQKAAQIMAEGHNVFSPIAHSHVISLHMDNSLDHDFWLNQDLSFLERWADEMWILTLGGWKDSEGVALEIETAKRMGLPVRMVG